MVSRMLNATSIMKRCRAQLTVRVPGRPDEHLWPGLEVNFARELAPGYTLAQAVAGRESCFEDVYKSATQEPGVETAPIAHVEIDPDDPRLDRATIRPVTDAPSPHEEIG